VTISWCITPYRSSCQQLSGAYDGRKRRERRILCYVWWRISVTGICLSTVFEECTSTVKHHLASCVNVLRCPALSLFPAAWKWMVCNGEKATAVYLLPFHLIIICLFSYRTDTSTVDKNQTVYFMTHISLLNQTPVRLTSIQCRDQENVDLYTHPPYAFMA
jgi:hypothetical protein